MGRLLLDGNVELEPVDCWLAGNVVRETVGCWLAAKGDWAEGAGLPRTGGGGVRRGADCSVVREEEVTFKSPKGLEVAPLDLGGLEGDCRDVIPGATGFKAVASKPAGGVAGVVGAGVTGARLREEMIDEESGFFAGLAAGLLGNEFCLAMSD